LTVLAYYSVAARQEFWTEHWGGHSVEELLAVARRSPLTALITRALPADGVILEAGCGLGQYVLLLREQGWRVAGVDWSVEALVACRRVAPAPLAAMELRSLAIRDAVLAAYVSLGVVEHDADGPDAILAEARRVLAPGGVLVVSVPYVNGVRQLGALWIRRRSRALARSGGEFYQYAFSRAELTATLTRHGFVVMSADPYDPARMLRQALRRILPGRSKRAGPGRALSLGTTLAPEPTPTPPAFDRRDRPLVQVARALLYTEALLRLLGHMLLVVARKP
jgi:SAM-dependent methyltransferase